MYLFVISYAVEQELWVMTTKRLDNRVYAAVIFHIFRGRVPVVCLLSCFLVKFTNAYDNSSCSTSRWLTAGEGSRNSDWKDENYWREGLKSSYERIRPRNSSFDGFECGDVFYDHWARRQQISSWRSRYRRWDCMNRQLNSIPPAIKLLSFLSEVFLEILAILLNYLSCWHLGRVSRQCHTNFRFHDIFKKKRSLKTLQSLLRNSTSSATTRFHWKSFYLPFSSIQISETSRIACYGEKFEQNNDEKLVRGELWKMSAWGMTSDGNCPWN